MRKIQPRGRAPTPVERARLVVEYRDPRALKPYGRNARRHPPQQVQDIRASMDRFGNNAPILLRDDDTTIGAGHGRWEAAMLEPAYEVVPTITLRGLTEAEWRAYVIADNKLAERSVWDEALLAAEVGEILALDDDLGGLIGFDPAELDALLKGADDAPRVMAPPAYSYQEQYGVIVVCPDEAKQKAAFEALQAQGYDCRVVCT